MPQNPVKVFEELANTIRAKKRQIESVEEQYAVRMRRAGIKLS